MAKIQLTENRLKKLIRESVSEVINEETLQAGQQYTLAQVVNNLKRAGWNGNVDNLLRTSGDKTGTPEQWAQSLNNLGTRTRNVGYQKLANQINQYTIDNKVAAAGAQNAMARGGEMQNMGRSFAKPNPGNFTSIAQAIQDIAAANPNRTISFQKEFTDSTGIFNGLDMNQVRNTINTKVRQANTTLKQTNPQAATITTQVNDWVNKGGVPLTAKQLASDFASLEKIVKTSYNDTAVVAGFQRAMNLFGTRMGVDGVIGQQTRAALQQAGYKDIFAFKSDVEAVQRALGVQPDGKIGKNTLAAMQQNGITNLQAFKQTAQGSSSIAQRLKNGPVTAIGASKTQPAGPSQITPSAQPAQTISEDKLRKIIKDSVETILKEYDAKNGNRINKPGFAQTSSVKPEEPAKPQPKKPGFGQKVKNVVKRARQNNAEMQKNMTPMQQIGYQNVMRGGFNEGKKKGGC